MKRRKAAELPACPFETGQRIKVKPKGSDEWITGTVSACLWFPFPGQWIPEVRTDDGTIYGIGGHAIPIREYDTIIEQPTADSWTEQIRHFGAGIGNPIPEALSTETAEDWIAAHPEIEAANEQSCKEAHSSQDAFGGRDWPCKNPCKPCNEIEARKRELHYAEHVRPDYTKLHDDIKGSIRLMEERHRPLRIEQTEAGAQVVAPGTPARTIPTSGLRPKVGQRKGPLPLELAEIEAKQQRLF